MPAPRRRKEKEVQLKGKCVVCGDKASSMSHYGSKVCFSCRAFFRRLANQDRVPEKKNCGKISNIIGECEIGIKTRQLCSFCRYQKCCLFGMKPKLVMSKTQIEGMRTKVQQKRNQKATKETRIKRSKVTNCLKVTEYQESSTIELTEEIDLSASTGTDEIKDILDQSDNGGSSIHKLDKCCRRLQAEKEELQGALMEAEAKLEHEEIKVRKAQLELGQVRQELDRHIQEKEKEFDNTRKNHQHTMESLDDCLEAEQHAKDEALCIKKKLESDINELEIALEKTNKANTEAQKTFKQCQDKLRDTVQEQACDHQEIHDQTNAFSDEVEKSCSFSNSDTEEEFVEHKEKSDQDMFDYLGYFLGQKVGNQVKISEQTTFEETHSFCHKSVKKRVQKTKKRGKPEEKFEVNSLDIKHLKAAPISINSPFLHLTRLATGESSMSSMPFTKEEIGFCMDLKQTKIDAWKSHPVPLEIFHAMISKQVMDGPQDKSLQRSNEIFAERLVILFKNLDLFKSLNEKDQLTLLSSNLHYSLILLSAHWFHPKHSGTAQVNMYLHGDSDLVQQNSIISSYNRIEIEELMPWCCGSHPMYQILQTVMQIDMDEVIFLLLVTITLLNSKEIKFRRIQDHLKLKLFRYLKHKSSQSEAVKQFHKIEEVIHKLLYSKDFYTLLQG